MTNPEASGGVTFVATYARPQWAIDMKASCGHSIAGYDLTGRCTWPGCERGYRSSAGLQEEIARIGARQERA